MHGAVPSGAKMRKLSSFSPQPFDVVAENIAVINGNGSTFERLSCMSNRHKSPLQASELLVARSIGYRYLGHVRLAAAKFLPVRSSQFHQDL